MKKIFILLLMICTLGTAFSAEIYVRFKKSTVLPQIQKGQKKVAAKLLPISSKLMSKYSVASQARSMSFMNNDILQRTFKISVPDSVDLDVFIEELRLLENVEMVEKNVENYILAVPNDTFYGTVAGCNLKWHLDLINAEKAWDSAEGKPNIRVAVVDNSVYGKHEDLQIPSYLQYDMVADSVGSSFPSISPSNVLASSFSHGTHCAGSIGAIKNNNIGIASLSSGITLMACGGWSFDDNKLGMVINGYEGIVWAAENGAKVISCSWGTTGASAYNNTHAEIIRECYEKGILVIAAAGNEGNTNLYYPAAYRGAVSVGSVDINHELSGFSNHGEWVTIAAPGGYGDNIPGSYSKLSIFSTVSYYNKGMADLTGNQSSPFYGKLYDRNYGTSMACPIVAAVAGLMLSKDSTLSPAQIITLMQTTAQDKDSGLDLSPNSGVIDAAAAINAVCAKTKCGGSVRNLSAERIYFDSIKVAWSAPLDTYSIKGYAVYCDNILLDSCYTDTVFYDRNLIAGTKDEKREYKICPVYYDSEVLQSYWYASVDIPKFHTLTLSATEGGSVSALMEGYPNYKHNTLVICEAIPDTGYVFVKWQHSDGFSFTNSVCSTRVTANATLEASFSALASIEEGGNFEAGPVIYPNPAFDYVNVSGLDLVVGAAAFEVLDMNGRRVFSGTLSGGRVDVSTLEAGVYVLLVRIGSSVSGSSSEEGVKAMKFIKK
jgi:subtilisin family serine protease